jgi:tetratricopeptide (TPR) repeat protein
MMNEFGFFSVRTVVVKIALCFLFVGCSDNQESHRWVIAEDYLAKGQHRRAIEEFSRIAGYSNSPEASVQALMQIASVYSNDLKNEMLAIKTYKEALQKSKDGSIRILIRKEMAKIYLDKLERPLLATEELRLAIEDGGQFEKDGPELLLLLGRAQMESGAYIDATETFSKYRKLYPGHAFGPKSLYDEGQSFLAAKQFDKAIALFREVIEKFSGNNEFQGLVGQSYYGLGSAFESKGDLKTALEAYRQSLALYPNKKVIELKIERVLKRQKDKQI